MAKDAGMSLETYRYYDKKTFGLDFAGMMADIKAAKDGSIFMFHACAHNPTGVDPTQEQWKEISNLCKAKGEPCMQIACPLLSTCMIHERKCLKKRRKHVVSLPSSLCFDFADQFCLLLSCRPHRLHRHRLPGLCVG